VVDSDFPAHFPVDRSCLSTVLLTGKCAGKSESTTRHQSGSSTQKISRQTSFHQNDKKEESRHPEKESPERGVKIIPQPPIALIISQ
jgi:hypothetical protein